MTTGRETPTEIQAEHRRAEQSAEEKLKERCCFCDGNGHILKRLECGCGCKLDSFCSTDCPMCNGTGHIVIEHIDLIADLVVERLKNERVNQ